jgi:hypothetical protein
MKSRYYFLFHTLSRLSIKVRLKYKNKMILIKYSLPIGMFPATQIWVATHRLRTTDLNDGHIFYWKKKPRIAEKSSSSGSNERDVTDVSEISVSSSDVANENWKEEAQLLRQNSEIQY